VLWFIFLCVRALLCRFPSKKKKMPAEADTLKKKSSAFFSKRLPTPFVRSFFSLLLLLTSMTPIRTHICCSVTGEKRGKGIRKVQEGAQTHLRTSLSIYRFLYPSFLSRIT
jgi:hypothetical protein